MKEFTLRVLPEEQGLRLDVYLSRFSEARHLGLSRNSIQKLIRQNNVTLDKEPVTTPNYKIRPGQVFKLEIPQAFGQGIIAEDIPLDIRFEDDDLMVINKPIGMVVHPGAGNLSGTLVNSLLFQRKSLSSIDPKRPGIVHRLDKDTSGLILVAKNNPSHYKLAKQFARHSITRRYIALVRGEVQFNEDVIELPIGRHPRQREKMSVFGKSDYNESVPADLSKSSRRLYPTGRGNKGARGKYAKTQYKVMKRGNGLTLLELIPFTGRTHQLRVHLSFIGHPIMGDKKYGRDNKFMRLALHAYKIGFIHPASNKFIEIETSIPDEFLAAVGQDSHDKGSSI